MVMQSEDAITSFLKRDEIKNMNMIYFLENNHIQSLERIGDSVLLRGESDHCWVYISSPNEEDLRTVLGRLTKDDRYFAVVEDWVLPMLTKGKTIVWQLSAMKLILPESINFPHAFKYPIDPLSVDDAKYIYEHSDYRAVTSPEYIRERIQRGLSAGVHISGQLAAWAMTHDDGAVGFLHVLEAHRRKGYGYGLTVYLIHKLRAQGKIPFIHIEETNNKSINLAMKLGFKKDRRVHWLEIQ